MIKYPQNGSYGLLRGSNFYSSALNSSERLPDKSAAPSSLFRLTRYVKNGSFESYKKYVIGEFDLTDDSYESVPSPVAGENNMTISVNTIEPGYSYALYFAIYKDGSLYKAVKTEQMDSAAGEAELKATINLDSVSDGVYSAKAFLWDDEMNPYIAKSSF